MRSAGASKSIFAGLGLPGRLRNGKRPFCQRSYYFVARGAVIRYSTGFRTRPAGGRPVSRSEI